MPCLNLQLRNKSSKLYIIYKKQTLIAIKTSFTHKNLKDIFMYEKKYRYNLFSLAAILEAILYQCSLINSSQIPRSHFEPFYAWKNLDFMQKPEFKFII